MLALVSGTLRVSFSSLIMSSYLPTKEVNSGNAHLVLNEATLTACRAAFFAAKEFSFDRDLNKMLIHHVNEFIETGEESCLTLVTLYLVKMRAVKEEQQLSAEEREIDRLREEKVRSDAEEDRHYLWLKENHSVAALH